MGTTYYTYSVFFMGLFVFSYVINKLVIVNSQTLGIKYKNNTDDRWSKIHKPSLGGISLYGAFMLSIPAYMFLMDDYSLFKNQEFIGLFVAANLAFLMGIYDDYSCTKPLLKLSVQILCGMTFILTDNAIIVSDSYLFNGILTILWVVAVMNSLNMLDNMDGITATVSLFILLACVTILLITGMGSPLWIVLIIAQMGAIIGFLAFNINPSQIFMGDGGSQFLALFVAFFGIKSMWNFPAEHYLPTWIAPLIVIAAFTPTIVDTLTVMINRTRRGVSIMLGGKDHTTHHLVYRGFSDLKVWKTFTLISMLSFLVAIEICYFTLNGNYLIALFGPLLFFFVFIPLYKNTLRAKPPQK